MSEQITPLIQRLEEEEEEKEPLQPKPDTLSKTHLHSGIKSQINSLKGRGQPLSKSSKAFFEPCFGRRFDNVRIHTDSNSNRLCASMHARAFTAGQDIVFGLGQHSPSTTAGRRLIAHELTHVLQQKFSPHEHVLSRKEEKPEQPTSVCDIVVTNPENDLEIILGPPPEQECFDYSEEEMEQVRCYIQQVLSTATDLAQWTKSVLEVYCPADYIDVWRQTIEGMVGSEIDFDNANKRNKKYAQSLKWGDHLHEYNTEWQSLWSSDALDSFAGAIAKFQHEQGFTGKDIDGILGTSTMDRLRPIGDVISEREVVSWPDANRTCTLAAQERLHTGWEQATGEKLYQADEQAKFEAICASHWPTLKNMDEKWWGTGPAGAMVFLGKATYVSEDEIWNKKALKPGAAIQVWHDTDYLEKLKKEERPSGTAFVFIRYDQTNPDKMWVLHSSGEEPKYRNTYDVWIAANVIERSEIEAEEE